MTTGTVASRLEKLKRIRSLDEVITRGAQTLSAYREQRRGVPAVPTDEEFVKLIDISHFGKPPIIAENLWQKFYKNGAKCFFPTFRDPESSAARYKEIFGDETADRFVEAAGKILAGRIDLLGYLDLDIGSDVDWHREPLSGKTSPRRHWNEFDDLDTSETGDKKIVWELNRHQHFFTLGVAYCLTGDERFAKKFVDHLASWMDQNPPGVGINWSSSLEISFRVMSWIWAFHIFRDSDHFTPETFRRALKYLYLQGCHIEKYLSTYYSPNTHLTGEALGLYYLGTQLPFFKRAREWKRSGEEILASEIEKQIQPDGVYFEQSTWYQRYTADFYCHFALLRSLSDARGPEASMQERLARALEFLMHMTMPDGRTPLIGDDDGGRMLPLTTAWPDDFRGSLALGAAVLKRADLKYAADGRSEEIFWLLGPEGISSYGSLQGHEPPVASKNFPDGGYCVMRDGWDETDNYMIVDCGEVGSLAGGHGHADALSIEVAVQGRTLLVDPGTYSYHESREIRDHFRSSAAHNTITIDEQSSSETGETFSWKTRADCNQKKWISEERFDLFEGSHNGYERLAKPAKHTRMILFLKGDYWIMRDLVETAGEHDYAVNFHYDPEIDPQISEDGSWIGDDVHRIWTFGDYGSWQKSECSISNIYGNKVNASLMKFRSRGYGTQEFFTFILPVDTAAAPPEVSEISVSDGRAFTIKFDSYTDVFLVNDGERSIQTELVSTNSKYFWARVSQGEILPEEFVVIEGNRLYIEDNDIFDSKDFPFVAARLLGHELYLKTDDGRRTVTLAPAERRKGERRQSASDRRRSS